MMQIYKEKMDHSETVIGNLIIQIGKKNKTQISTSHNTFKKNLSWWSKILMLSYSLIC